MGVLDVPAFSRLQSDNRFLSSLKPARAGALGADATLTAFPTVGSFSAGNAATSLTGTTTTVFAGDSFGSWKGTWASGTAYSINDAVQDPTSGDVSWIAIAASTNVTPGTDSTIWRKAGIDSRFGSVSTPLKHWRQVPSGQGSFHNGAQNAFQVNGDGFQQNTIPVFVYTGTGFEIVLPGQGGKLLLVVDGVTDTAGWRAIPSGGQEYRLPVTFSTVDTHTIAVMLASNNFTGLTMAASDVLAAPEPTSHPVVVMAGDSETAGQNNDGSSNGTNGAPIATRLDTFSIYLGRMMNWNVLQFGQGGTGLLNPGNQSTNPGFSKLRDKLGVIAAQNPALLIAPVGLNDQTSASAAYTAAANTAEMTALLAAAATLMPKTRLVVVGPFYTNDAATDSVNFNSIKTVRDAQLAAFTAAGAVAVPAAAAWVIPNGAIFLDSIAFTGKKGTSGSANVLLSGDGIHFNQFGHRFVAQYLRRALNTLMVLGYLKMPV